MEPIKLRVLSRDVAETSKKRPVAMPIAPETIIVRGTDSNAPDLVCGSCHAVLAVGISRDSINLLIGCTRCGAVNEALTIH